MVSKVDMDCMKEALALAAQGRGFVSPNPMVGAVLMHAGRIIGKGYHAHYGGPHAEVNCLEDVCTSDRHLIAESTLYVTLEPCAHFGKTPPCADLVIRSGIPRVVVATTDPFHAVQGKGIARMQDAGIDVQVGIMEGEAVDLNARFFTYHRLKRPYITLKWAETADGFIGTGTPERLLISSAETNSLVHAWRAAEDAILIGSKTAELDNPSLTVRHVAGKSPLRIILQGNTPLPGSLKMFHDGCPVLVVNREKNQDDGMICHVQVDTLTGPSALMKTLYDMKIQGLMVEGGRKTIQFFLEGGCWDEIKIITNTGLYANGGVPAPQLPADAVSKHERQSGNDRITTFKKK
jgi:diaminohydroxyphosphoribosylaminopyrimidine deaminase / 5-amino-6-(5-phosphoribosylamino)uracil reductase